MEENEFGRQSSLGLLQTMTALLSKFHYVTLACDDIMTIQTHMVMLVEAPPPIPSRLCKE